MPSTIERSGPPNVVAHATEYPPDRQRREEWQGHEDGNESREERHDESAGGKKSSPDAYIISHYEADHRLDGVNAYTMLGNRQPNGVASGRASVDVRRRGPLSSDEYSSGEASHAYHPPPHDDEDVHEVNVAT